MVLIVDTPLLSAAASGHQKYTEYIEWQRADKAKSAIGVKRKALSDEITAPEKRQTTVQCAIMHSQDVVSMSTAFISGMHISLMKS